MAKEYATEDKFDDREIRDSDRIGQEFDVWKKELEKWNENDKSSDEAKCCNLLESLKKNDKIF